MIIGIGSGAMVMTLFPSFEIDLNISIALACFEDIILVIIPIILHE